MNLEFLCSVGLLSEWSHAAAHVTSFGKDCARRSRDDQTRRVNVFFASIFEPHAFYFNCIILKTAFIWVTDCLQVSSDLIEIEI